jgi:hypothetical protein
VVRHGRILQGYFIPLGSDLVVLVSGFLATMIGRDQDYHLGPCQSTRMQQWREISTIAKNKGIQLECRQCDEDFDAPCIKMKMIAIRRAQETMERGVSERDNPSTFLA